MSEITIVQTPLGPVRIGHNTTPSSGVTASMTKIKQVVGKLIRDGITIEKESDERRQNS